MWLVVTDHISAALESNNPVINKIQFALFMLRTRKRALVSSLLWKRLNHNSSYETDRGLKSWKIVV